MRKAVKIAGLMLMLTLVWFTISIKGGKAYLKIGTWEHPIVLSEADTSTPDSTDTEFA